MILTDVVEWPQYQFAGREQRVQSEVSWEMKWLLTEWHLDEGTEELLRFKT